MACFGACCSGRRDSKDSNKESIEENLFIFGFDAARTPHAEVKAWS
jgi:hypothetical protein